MFLKDGGLGSGVSSGVKMNEFCGENVLKVRYWLCSCRKTDFMLRYILQTIASKLRYSRSDQSLESFGDAFKRFFNTFIRCKERLVSSLF